MPGYKNSNLAQLNTKIFRLKHRKKIKRHSFLNQPIHSSFKRFFFFKGILMAKAIKNGDERRAGKFEKLMGIYGRTVKCGSQPGPQIKSQEAIRESRHFDPRTQFPCTLPCFLPL